MEKSKERKKQVETILNKEDEFCSTIELKFKKNIQRNE